MVRGSGLNIRTGQMKNNQGTALIELVICMLPYILIIMGAIFFWHLVAGKQEAVKYFTTSSTLNDTSLKSEYFFGKMKGMAYVGDQVTYDNEEDFNSVAGITEDDEPVLPYDSNGDDMQRAFELSGTQVYFDSSSGGYKVRRTQAGSRIAQLGLMGNLDTSTVYNEGDDISVDITDEDDVLPQISVSLGDWIDYKSSTANYSYALPLGRGRLPFESKVSTSQTWRSEEGIKVFPRDVSSFWAVINNPYMRDWGDDVSSLSSALATIYKTSAGAVAPSSLTSSEIDGSYVDVGVLHGSSVNSPNW